MKSSKHVLYGFAAAMVLTSATLSHVPAFAQDAVTADDAGVLEVVVVTAQRREENLQKVPVAVTAIGTEQLDDARITNVTNLSGLAPNLHSEAAAGGNRIPILNIRGVVAGNGTIGIDNQVGIYIDGVYVGNIFGSMQDVADIERVEVLRGPQGTLFGRNSTGGAIQFVTAKPTGELGGRLFVSAGNFDSRRIKASMDFAEVNGLSLKASVLHFEERGHVRNLGAGTQFDWSTFTLGQADKVTASKYLGGANFDGIHLAARYDGGDRLLLDYSFGWSEGEYTNEPFQVFGFTDTGFTAGIFANSAANGAPILISPTRLEAVDNWLSSDSVQENQSHTLVGSYDFSSSVSLKNIANYRTVETSPTSNQLDGAGGLVYNSGVFGNPMPEPAVPAFLLGISPVARDMEQFSNEIQLSVTTDKLDLIAGYYYFKLDDSDVPGANVAFLRLAPGNVVGGSAFNPADTQLACNTFVDTRSQALFAQGTVHLTDRLDLTAGTRWTDDKKTIRNPNFPMGVPNPFVYDDTHTDWLVNVGFDFSDSVYGYAKVNTGFLSGGAANGVAFNPEEITNYELGLRSTLYDNRLTLNLTGFFMDYEELQFIDPSSGSLNTINAGKVEIKGIELEAVALPTDRLSLSANLGIADTNLKELAAAVLGNQTLDDYQLGNRPQRTASLAAEFEVARTEFGVLTVSADAQHHSNKQFATGAAIADSALNAASQTGSVWLLNMRASLSEIPFGSATGVVSVWGRNLTDDDSITAGNNLGTVFAGSFRRPRSYGIDFTVEF